MELFRYCSGFMEGAISNRSMTRENGPAPLTAGILQSGNARDQCWLERVLWKLSRDYRRRLLRLILDWD